ncbi:MAG TPA: hypothetical protein VM778_07595 [Gemmatimonadota bacterium]|nr:hypothetical protein [Gemmatimonadota bacterium]
MAEVAAAVRARLTGDRRAHAESVVETARRIAEAGGWPADVRAAAERAAWWHDALKPDGLAAWRDAIESAGETPDPWAAAHGPGLLHAQAAAVWAAARGETDPEVLSAVRHHPTGWPDWGPVGRILYVSDFAEPGRAHAARVGADGLLARAGAGAAGLAAAARDILALRIAYLLERRSPVHPDSLEAWNAWVANAGSEEGE